MMPLSVDADISAEEDLLGKYATALQNDIEVGDSAITGTLKWVTGYTGFSGDPAEQSGNYIALHAESDHGATISVEVVGGFSGPVNLTSDGLAVLRIESTSQKIRYTAMKAGKVTKVRTFSLADLTLTPETATVELENADADDSGSYSEEELTALTKAQLLALAETLGVTGVTSSSTKAQIIAAILAAQEEG